MDRDFVAGRGIRHTLVKETDWKPLDSIGTGDPSDPDTFVSKGPFRPIDKTTDYDHSGDEPTFIPSAAASDVMSIVDVYRSVRGAPAGSVLELSLFSHGWIGGPILVNSFDNRHDPNERDPQDKDGRAALDFNLIMGETDGSPLSLLHRPRFMLSFDPQGIMQTWGCNFDIELRIIQQAQKRISRGGVTDATLIDFHFEDWAPGRYQLVDPAASFLPSDSSIVDISRTFGATKKFLRRRLQQSYAFQFASSSSGQTGMGALPGTEGDDQKTGFRLMQICAKYDPPECPVGFASLFNFYRKHLGVAVDNRGYGIFDAATITKLNADIAADGP